jgi:type VI protein secretion system component VasK
MPALSDLLPAVDATLLLIAAAVFSVIVLAVAVIRRRRRRPPKPRPVRPDHGPLLRRLAALVRAAAQADSTGDGPSLPWWIVVGPAGHGKSALLAAAPQCREIEPGPAGAPRFFLAPTGAFIELPDSCESQGPLLRALERARPQPIAGVLAVLRADALDDDAHHQATRRQLEHVISTLSTQAPVVLVVNQLDRLVGFAELISDLSSRTPVLGATLPLREGQASTAAAARERLGGDGGPLPWIRQRCHALLARANIDDDRSARVHGFWQLFACTADEAARFAGTLAAASLPGDEPARVRAIYFLSARPAAPPTSNTWLADLAARIGAGTGAATNLGETTARSPAEPLDPVFVADLFTLELPRDSRHADRLRTFHDRRAIRRTLAGATALLAATILAYFATTIARADRSLLRATWSGARGVVTPTAGLLPPLSEFTALDEAVATWRAADRRGPTLVDGREIGSRAAEVLRGAVCRAVMRQVAVRNERALRDFSGRYAGGGVPTDLEWSRAHDRLRMYMLLSDPAEPGEPAPYDKNQSTWLIEHVSKSWAAAEGARADERRLTVLQRHLELVRSDPAPASGDDPCGRSGDARAAERDPTLVAAAREILHRRPVERVAVDRIVAAIDRSDDLRSVDRASLTTAGALIGDASVPPAFTRDGWEAFRAALRDELRDRSDQRWLLGPDAPAISPAQRCERMRGLYVAGYERAWREFFAALRLRAASSLPEAATQLQEIAEQTPLLAVFQAIAEHTQRLTPLGCPTEDRAFDLLARVVAPTPINNTAPDAPDVARTFARLVAFGVPAAKRPVATALDSYHERIADVRSAVAAALDDNAAVPSLQIALTSARRSVDDLLRRGAASEWTDALDRLLTPPLSGLELLVNNAAGRELNAEWCAAVVQPLAQTIAGRYPFAADARADARLDDLARLFHPKTGEIARFRDARLGGFLSVSGNSVRTRELGVAASLHLHPRTVDLFDAAHKLGVLLFPGDAPELAAELTLACDPSVHKVSLTIDGAEHTYMCSIDHAKQIRWPGDEPRGAVLDAHGPAGRRGELLAAGDFGLFRLLERARPQGRVGAFDVTFDLVRHGLGALKIAVRPRPVRGGDLFYGFTDAGFLAPFRAAGFTAPPHALFAELAYSCAP